MRPGTPIIVLTNGAEIPHEYVATTERGSYIVRQYGAVRPDPMPKLASGCRRATAAELLGYAAAFERAGVAALQVAELRRAAERI